MSSDSNKFWIPSPATAVGVVAICVVGAVLLHCMSRNTYLRVVRDQESAPQSSPPVQLQQLPPRSDIEAQPVGAVEEPAKQTPTAVVLVLHPDNKVTCAVEQGTSKT